MFRNISKESKIFDFIETPRDSYLFQYYLIILDIPTDSQIILNIRKCIPRYSSRLREGPVIGNNFGSPVMLV